jgi:hypothetical protein
MTGTIPGLRATVERWEGSPLERARKDEVGSLDRETALRLVGTVEADECSLVSLEDRDTGRFLHVSCSRSRYSINACGPEETYFLRTTPRSCADHVRLWVAGFEWEFHCRFVLDRAEAEAAVEELVGHDRFDFGNGRWEEAGVGPDSRPFGMPAGGEAGGP